MQNHNDPTSPVARAERLFHAGNRHLERHDNAAAEQCFREAIALNPAFGEAHTNLAFLLDVKGQPLAAEIAYQQALACGADSPELHLNLGVLLTAQKRFEEALRSYANALRCAPDSSAVWSNLGVLWLMLKQDEDAATCLHRALELNPANTKAQFNLAYLHLRQGRFDSGWHYFESRSWYGPATHTLGCARWNKGAPLVGQSIVVCFDAGHGDVIQFCRYIPLLKKARGAARVTLVCHPGLTTLMQTVEGLDTVMGFDQELPEGAWDCWVPLLSLPYHFDTRGDTIPAPIPYLAADRQAVQDWAALLPRSGLRVGLVWKGNPSFENDSERSLPRLQTLAPLWEVPGVVFVSLQKSAGDDDGEPQRDALPMLRLGPRLRDFADTAAVVCNLDLVICVDTAVAHLAGALGKPCWVLLPDFMADWRWLSEGTSSAWYPGTMRLFRQHRRGDWSGVVHEVAHCLSREQAAPFVRFLDPSHRSSGSGG